MDAGGLEAEHRRKISSFTCQIHPVLELLLLLVARGEFALMFCGSNMCLIFRQDVGAIVGAATLRFRLLKAAPCHGAEGDVTVGDVTGVDVELGCVI